jgi:DNA-binding SARP family transcriptional activator
MRACEEAGRPEAGVDAYQRLIDADPLYEAPYRNFMLSCQRAGDLAGARAAYEQLRGALAAKRKAMPSAETQAVYAALALPAQK